MSARYRVVFDRIGRDRDVPPLIAKAAGGVDLAERVYRYARPRLLSRDVDVAVDLEAGKGHILCGWHNGGTFTVERMAHDLDGGA